MANRFAQYAQPDVTANNPKLQPEVTHQTLENAQLGGTLPYAAPKARADVIKAQAEAAQAPAQEAATTRQKQAEAGSAEYKAESDKIIADRMAMQKKSFGDSVDALVNGVQQARAILQANPNMTTGNTYEIMKHVHGTDAAKLDALLNGQIKGGLFSQRLGQYREEGGTNPSGAGSPPRIIQSEVPLITNALGTLDPGDLGYQGTLNSLQSIEAYAKRSKAFINGDNPDEPTVRQKYGIPEIPQPQGGTLAGTTPPSNAPRDTITASKQLPNITGDNSPQVAQSAGGRTRDEIDPVLRLRGQIIGKMIANGVPDQKIKDYVQQNGIQGSNIDDILQYRNSGDFQKWKQQNPGVVYPLGPSFYTRQVPMSEGRQLFNQAAASGPGGAAAAGIIGAGNAVTGDRAGGLMGPDAQLSMQLMRQNHPIASAVGDAAGQGLMQAALPGEGALATIGKDALYGAYSGSGDSGPGAVPGAIFGAGAGLLGRGAQTLAGGAIKGVKNTSLGYLNSQGVPLTLGQIGRGSSSVVGRSIGGLEERLQGLPGLDAVIGAARRRGDEGFNAAAFKQAGGTGATGAQGLGELNNLRNKAYSFLDGTQIPVDPAFNDAQSAVRATLPNMTTDHATGVGGVLNNIDNTASAGAMAGRDWQSNIQAVRGARSSIGGQPYSDLPRDALGTTDDNLMDLAARNGPPGTTTSLADANKLHANTETLLAAVGKPASQRSDELFSPTGLNTSAISGARKYQGAMSALTGNRPFYDLSKAGMDVMPNLTPDSGTAGRLAVLGAITALGTGVGAGVGAEDGGEEPGEGALSGGEKGLGYGLALGSLALGPYSKFGQRVIQKALLGDRPQAISTLGDLIRSNSKVGGLLAQGRLRNNQYSLGDLARTNQLTNFNN